MKKRTPAKCKADELPSLWFFVMHCDLYRMIIICNESIARLKWLYWISKLSLPDKKNVIKVNCRKICSKFRKVVMIKPGKTSTSNGQIHTVNSYVNPRRQAETVEVVSGSASANGGQARINDQEGFAMYLIKLAGNNLLWETPRQTLNSDRYFQRLDRPKQAIA